MLLPLPETVPLHGDRPAISVVIPARNEAESIEGCLRSIDRQDLEREAFEIVVVDGNSTDDTVAIAEQYADAVFVQRRSGIGGARRDGAEAARGDVLVFTDADSSFEPAWLPAIAENLVLQGYDVSTGPILFQEGSWRSDLLQLWRKVYTLMNYFNYYRLIGPNIAITRPAYDRIHGHADISILEDYDLSIRLRRERNLQFSYDPRQVVYTSARRICNLLGYVLLFLYGQYHYHVTRDYERLRRYPRFDGMNLAGMLEALGSDAAKGDERSEIAGGGTAAGPPALDEEEEGAIRIGRC
ncbi:MAG: glycosyltransferase [Methanomicrobiales archaeon]|nr:glycosyltransferase [Methanomicrobiales archaeon]